MSDVLTPYSTLADYDMLGEVPTWTGTEQDNERLAAYVAYERMYWSVNEAFELIRRNDDGRAVYLPKPKVIVDTTAHYLLKGMQVGPKNPEKADPELVAFLEAFMKRERFYSRFQVAKLAGVTRGDFVFHLTADPQKEEGSRISLNSVDPAFYFPEYDTDDLEKRTGAKLVEQMADPTDPNKVVLKILRYWHEYDPATGRKASPLVWREESVWEVKDWWDPKKAQKVKQIIPPSTLPTDITSIPLYHFKNAEWDGYYFGNSELKGLERIFQAMDQAISDEEISLALTGLGVYATDAGRPRDSQGRETDWIVAPGTVWEMPGATMVKRLEGITSVTPVMDHLSYLETALFEASGTSEPARGVVDVNTAESGIALALKFVPTLAKIEYRDTAGVEILTQLWYDWLRWVKSYENKDYTSTELVITLGEKLPLNRPKILEELNQMYDRKVISAQFYRDEVKRRLGYNIPDDMEQQILDEEVRRTEALMEVQQQQMNNQEDQPDQIGPGGRKVGAGDTKSAADRNRSNNKGRVNESNGTEVRS